MTGLILETSGCTHLILSEYIPDLLLATCRCTMRRRGPRSTASTSPRGISRRERRSTCGRPVGLPNIRERVTAAQIRGSGRSRYGKRMRCRLLWLLLRWWRSSSTTRGRRLESVIIRDRRIGTSNRAVATRGHRKMRRDGWSNHRRAPAVVLG